MCSIKFENLFGDFAGVITTKFKIKSIDSTAQVFKQFIRKEKTV